MDLGNRLIVDQTQANESVPDWSFLTWINNIGLQSAQKTLILFLFFWFNP